MDMFAALLVMALAGCERPAVPFLTLPVGVIIYLYITSSGH